MDIKTVLTNVTPIEDEVWNDFEQYFSESTLRKYSLLWKAGEVCKHLVFIKQGLIRCFRIIEEKEITTHFYFESNIFYDDYSFVTQHPGINTYEALEETTLIVIPRAALNLMFDRYKSFERLGRLMAEFNHSRLIEQHQHIKHLSSKKKYENLIAQQPQIIQRVPLKIIASYLNMTPEHLSKLRKELSAIGRT